MYVCLCKGITDSQIKETIEGGCLTVRDLSSMLEIGTQCGKCIPVASQILSEELAKKSRYTDVA